MQVYLSSDLYDIVKSQGLSASRLLQDAVRNHCVRQERVAAAHAYVQEVYKELGPPSAEETEWADDMAREIIDSLRHNELSPSEARSGTPTS